MTFREKLAKEYPEEIRSDYFGGCRDCPSSYGYEPAINCEKEINHENCGKCWDRKVPEKKKGKLK